MKNIFSFLFLSIAISFAQIPGGKKVKLPDGSSPAYEAARKVFNKAVKDIPFEVNSHNLKKDDPKYSVAGVSVDTFMKKTLIPALSQLLNHLPSDKKVHVVGHASATGSEEPSESFIGNQALSQKRGEAVLNFLMANSDLDRSKFKVIGKGSSETLGGLSPKNDKNCRVSLDIK